MGYKPDGEICERVLSNLGHTTLDDWRAVLRRAKGRANSTGLLPLLAKDAAAMAQRRETARAEEERRQLARMVQADDQHAEGLRAARLLLERGTDDAARAVIFRAYPELAHS